jgi:hypothetical protein
VSVIYIINVAVTAEVKGKYVKKRDDIIVYITGRPRREKVNIKTDAKSNNARKYDRDKG